MKRLAVSVFLPLAFGGCALASGYDPSRYPPSTPSAPDPDTAPLPGEAVRTIPDPRGRTASTPKPEAPKPELDGGLVDAGR